MERKSISRPGDRDLRLSKFSLATLDRHSVSLFTAFAGIACADARHDIRIESAECEAVEFDCIPTRPETVAA